MRIIEKISKKENRGTVKKEDKLPKNDKPSEEIMSEPDDREEEPPKKGFWSRLFGK